jgi:NAD(P)H-hydrate epimerase
MKILPVSLIREADAFTISHEPISGIDLMERAATACFEWIKEHVAPDRKIMVFCGPGNNGGDGLAIARMMINAGFRVNIFCLAHEDKLSENCKVNIQRIKELNIPKNRDYANDALQILDASKQLPRIEDMDVVIDAIFGSGLARPAEGFPAKVIQQINSSHVLVVAIDVPSGLFCDDVTRMITPGSVINADYTLTFAPPKLAFFFPENDAFAGNWQLLDIGLSKDFIASAEVSNFMTDEATIGGLLKKRNKFSHKGTYGHALIISGHTGKMGAAVLSAKACLRAGAGLVTMRVPRSGVTILQTAVPEAMLSIDRDEDQFSELPDLAAYSAISIGPGIGTSMQTSSALKFLIQETKIPLIFDADAINILAENKTWLGFLPENSIFTPHPKEFERLAGKSNDHFDRNRLQREFSLKHRSYVVLKGAHTAITTPDGRCFFNTTGNPGMGTGGTGDVLTGILTGLIARGYQPLEACMLGVYIHGLSGDLAAQEQGFEALIAGDIVNNLGKSFQLLYGKF